jgi:hypothetical protein
MVLNTSGDVGVRVAVLVAALYETVAGTSVSVSEFVSETVEPLIVAGSIGSLNVTLTASLIPTPTAPFNGVTDMTVGAVVSGALPTENADENAVVSELPAMSFTSVVTISVYPVLNESGADGTNVAVKVAAL